MKKSILTFIALSAGLLVNGQQIPNGGFENWKTTSFGPITYEEPEGWQTFNFFTGANIEKPVSKTSDRNGGSLALLATNVVSSGFGTVDTIPGIAYTKFKTNLPPISITGYYKSEIKKQGDSVAIAALATKYNKVTKQSDFIGIASFTVSTSQAVYKSFTAQFFAFSGSVPDSITITITSSDKNNTPGTAVWVDDLAINYGPAAIDHQTDAENKEVNIYPSPASEVFYITGLKENTTNFKLINSQGLEVKNGLISNSTLTEINILDQPKGLYFIETFDKSQNRTSRQKVTIK
ncbi:MAG: T9SS type A sorting domain-containing protein [Opitutaceae bacterium]|nr:T9SS type A sorting domain-containing protein [Cytophagales bacterium]